MVNSDFFYYKVIWGKMVMIKYLGLEEKFCGGLERDVEVVL